MELHSEDQSWELGEFISSAFGIYFPFVYEYGSDFDVHPSPLAYGHDASLENDQESESKASD